MYTGLKPNSTHVGLCVFTKTKLKLVIYVKHGIKFKLESVSTRDKYLILVLESDRLVKALCFQRECRQFRSKGKSFSKGLDRYVVQPAGEVVKTWTLNKFYPHLDF